MHTILFPVLVLVLLGFLRTIVEVLFLSTHTTYRWGQPRDILPATGQLGWDVFVEHVLHVLLDVTIVGVHIVLLIFAEEFIPECSGLFPDGVPVSLGPLFDKASRLLGQASFNLGIHHYNVMVRYPWDLGVNLVVLVLAVTARYGAHLRSLWAFHIGPFCRYQVWLSYIPNRYHQHWNHHWGW